jgi:hypothetical protein
LRTVAIIGVILRLRGLVVNSVEPTSATSRLFLLLRLSGKVVVIEMLWCTGVSRTGKGRTEGFRFDCLVIVTLYPAREASFGFLKPHDSVALSRFST